MLMSSAACRRGRRRRDRAMRFKEQALEGWRE
jgi:hypothetical protein